MTDRKPLRERMPQVAAQIDSARARHGAEPVDDRLRRAKAGEPVFYAKEGAAEFGALPPALESWAAEMQSAFGTDITIFGVETGPDLPFFSSDPETADTAHRGGGWCLGCYGSCIGTSKRCSEQQAMRALRTRADVGAE